MSSERIKTLQRNAAVKLSGYLMELYKNDRNKAFEVLYNSLTYDYLMKSDTEMFLKSHEELVYMLKLELANDMDTWFRQV